jgi:hypothetical protein
LVFSVVDASKVIRSVSCDLYNEAISSVHLLERSGVELFCRVSVLSVVVPLKVVRIFRITPARVSFEFKVVRRYLRTTFKGTTTLKTETLQKSSTPDLSKR